MLKKIMFFCAFTGAFLMLRSQNAGWDYVLKGDYSTAHTRFQESLKQDSLDESALGGLIYLAYSSGNVAELRRYVQIQARHTRYPEFLRLFRTALPDQDWKLPKLDDPVKQQLMDYHSGQNTTLMQGTWRKNREQHAALFPDFFWQVLGPITTTSNRSIYYPYGPEYALDNDAPVFLPDGTLKPWYRMDTCGIGSGDLPISSNSVPGIYYFKTHFNVSAPTALDIRLATNLRFRLWVDGEELFTYRNPGIFWPDKFITSNTFLPGDHTVMIKIQVRKYMDEDLWEDGGDRSRFLYDFRMPVISAHGSMSIDKTESVPVIFDYDKPAAELRITDAAGNLAPQVKTLRASMQPLGKVQGAWKKQVRGMDAPFMDRLIVDGKPRWENFFYAAMALYMDGRGSMLEDAVLGWMKEQSSADMMLLMKSMGQYDQQKYRAAVNTLRKSLDWEPHFLAAWDDEEETGFNIFSGRDETPDSVQIKKLEAYFPGAPQVIQRYYAWMKKQDSRAAQAYLRKKLETWPEYRPMFAEILKETEVQEEKGRKKGRGTNSPLVLPPSAEKGISTEDKKLLTSNLQRDFGTEKGTLLAQYFLAKAERDFRAQETFSQADRVYAETVMLTHGFRFNDGMNNISRALLKQQDTTAALQAWHRYMNTCIPTSNEVSALAKLYRNLKQPERADSLEKRWNSLPEDEERKSAQRDSLIERVDSLYSFIPELDSIRRMPPLAGAAPPRGYEILHYSRRLVYVSPTEAEEKSGIWMRVLNETGVEALSEHSMEFMGMLRKVEHYKPAGKQAKPEVRFNSVIIENLAPGDLIFAEGERDYGMRAEDYPYGFSTLMNFSFQVPVRNYTLQVGYPKHQTPDMKFHNITPEIRQDTLRDYVMKRCLFRDLPEVRNQEGGRFYLDGLFYGQITTVPDWKSFQNWYVSLTEDMLPLDAAATRIADSLIHPGMSRTAIVDTLYRYVTRSIRYTNNKYAQGPFQPQPAAISLAEGLGDCKDVSTVLIALLRKSGIPAWYTLLATSQYLNDGFMPGNYFNHAIVAYDTGNGMAYLDPTADYFAAGTLPPPDCQSRALVIRPGMDSLIYLPNAVVDPRLNGAEVQIKARLDAQFNMSLEIDVDAIGASSGNLREMVRNAPYDKTKSEITHYMGLQDALVIKLDTITWQDNDRFGMRLPLRIQASSRNAVQKAGSYLVLGVPYMFTKNYFPELEARDRRAGADLMHFTNVDPVHQVLRMNLPEGYQLLEMPAPVQLKSAFGTYSLRFTLKGNELEVDRRFVPAAFLIRRSEFDSFLRFWNQMVDADQQKLLLKKKVS